MDTQSKATGLSKGLTDTKVKTLKTLPKAYKVSDSEGLYVLVTATRALQTTNQVFRYAIAHGHASRNPASDIRISDLIASHKKVNYARVPKETIFVRCRS